MEIKYTSHFLNKLEDLFSESDFILRYEKGSFKAGYCVLKSNGIVVVNKYFTTEGKINAIIEILRTVPINIEKMCEKNKSLFEQITK